MTAHTQETAGWFCAGSFFMDYLTEDMIPWLD